MKPAVRIALHFLAPPFLGAVVGILAASTWTLLHGGRWSAILREVHDYPPTFLYAYIFGIVPSAIYTAIMEWAARRSVEPGGSRAVLLSGMLGLVAGISILLPFMTVGPKFEFFVLLYLGGIGLIVGSLLEWLMGRMTPVRSP